MLGAIFFSFRSLQIRYKLDRLQTSWPAPSRRSMATVGRPCFRVAARATAPPPPKRSSSTPSVKSAWSSLRSALHVNASGRQRVLAGAARGARQAQEHVRRQAWGRLAVGLGRAVETRPHFAQPAGLLVPFHTPARGPSAASATGLQRALPVAPIQRRAGMAALESGRHRRGDVWLRRGQRTGAGGG